MGRPTKYFNNPIKLHKDSLAIIAKDKKMIFIYDLVVELGISEALYYKIFNDNLELRENVMQSLEANKRNIKKQMRNRWYDSESATLNVAVYKLLADDEEFEKLNNRTIINNNTTHEIAQPDFGIDEEIS